MRLLAYLLIPRLSDFFYLALRVKSQPSLPALDTSAVWLLPRPVHCPRFVHGARNWPTNGPSKNYLSLGATWKEAMLCAVRVPFASSPTRRNYHK